MENANVVPILKMDKSAMLNYRPIKFLLMFLGKIFEYYNKVIPVTT